jgi:hypothetical protein
MQKGTLFTDDFLREGIRATSDWQELVESEFEATEAKLKAMWVRALPAFPADSRCCKLHPVRQ